MLDVVVREAAERWGDATCLVAPAGWSLSYRELDRLSDEVAAGLLAAGVRRGRCGRAVPADQSRPRGRLRRLRQGRRDLRRDQPSPHRARAGCRARSRGRPALVLERRRWSATVARRPCWRRCGLRPVTLPRRCHPTPIGRSRSCSPRAPPGSPRARCSPTASSRFITEVDTGQRWGGGGPALGSTSLAHLGPTTKLAGNLMRGGTTYLVDRWRAGDALAHDRRGTAWPSMAGIPTQVALMLHHPDFDVDRPVVRAGGRARRRTGHTGARREIRERLGAPGRRPLLVHRGRHRASAPRSPIHPRTPRSRSDDPTHGVELALRDPDSGDRRAPTARSARSACAPPP